jgi:RNA polymerase sigma-70 factor (sigma-E family)
MSRAVTVRVRLQGVEREGDRMGRTESWESEFIAFVVARSPALLRTAFLLTADRGYAEDLVQTALAKTYAAWPRIRDVGAVEAYVRRTMLTTYTSWRRRRHWFAERPTEDLPEIAAAAGPEDLLGGEEVWAALRGLSPKQRAVLVLRFGEDLAVEEVARLLDLPIGTVKSHSSRGLTALRARLSEPASTPSTRRSGVASNTPGGPA